MIGDGTKAQTHTKENATVAVAVSTVAVVVRQLIRGNAIAHFVFVPWCDKNPRKEAGKKCIDRCHKARLRRGLGAKAMGSGTQNDELLRHVPANVAYRQPEAEPEEPEEQGIDVPQVVSEPQLSRSNACLNFHHFENSQRWLF